MIKQRDTSVLRAHSAEDTRKIVLVDIDGTMSLIGDRLKYIQKQPKDWQAFFDACSEDEVNWPIARLVRLLSLTRRIIFCTARSEDHREETCAWLRDKAHFPFPVVLMRPSGDNRPDVIVKPEQVDQAGIKLDDVYLVIEDRTRLAKKWRELGFTCLQVDDGEF